MHQRVWLQGLAKDARAALAYALKQPEVDPARVYVFGRSLGGAVAIRLASENLKGVRVPPAAPRPEWQGGVWRAWHVHGDDGVHASRVCPSVCVPHAAQVRGVIVENTFLSIDDMVGQLFPVLAPFKWFLNMHYPSGDRVANLTQPVLLISVRPGGLQPSAHRWRPTPHAARGSYFGYRSGGEPSHVGVHVHACTCTC